MKRIVLVTLAVTLIAAMLFGFTRGRLCYDSVQQVEFIYDDKVQYGEPRSLYVERFGPNTCVYGVTMAFSLDSVVIPPKLQQGQIIRIYAWKHAVDNRSSSDYGIIPVCKVFVIANEDPGADYIHTFTAIMDTGPYVVGTCLLGIIVIALFHRKKTKKPEESPAPSVE